jgi:HSP20 family molecular chaperone IbpA
MSIIPIHPDSLPTPDRKQMDAHHFHFPPTSLLAASTSFGRHLRAEMRKLSHAADGERGVASYETMWGPNTDIRQTKLAYHIEMEVPGTTDKEKLSIQWLKPSTLIVSGEIERPFVGHGKELEHQGSLKEDDHNANHVSNAFTYQSSTGSKHLEGGTKKDGGELRRKITDPGDECDDTPIFLLGERKTGPWQRTFTLPHNVEMKMLKARLEGGLLRIDIPIGDVSEAHDVKVEIE